MPMVEPSAGINPMVHPAHIAVPTAERCSRRENSNLIQITSPDTSFWRGKIWSSITFKIKVDNYFVQNAASGGQGVAGGPSCAAYTIRPTIVDAKTDEVYGPAFGGMLKLEFGKNALATDASVATVTDDPYNTIEAEFHQDLFLHGDSFFLVVEASRENDDEVIFGRSPTITVTNFSLAIEECFLTNPHVVRVNGSDFGWYSKCGGDKAGLSVNFHLKDEKGRIVNTFDTAFGVKTELVYDDGSPTPLMPMSPLKERRSSHLSRNTLYRPLVADPIFQPRQASHPFAFRIEEVSFHHPGRAGFKLKVSPADPTQNLLHPGLLEENIIVLSKPKPGGTKTKKRGGRSKVPLPKNEQKHHAPKPPKVRKVSIIDSRPTSDVNDSTHVVVPTSALVSIVRSGGKCRFCNKAINPKAFLNLKSHRAACQFSAKVLASLEGVDSTKIRRTEGERQPNLIQVLGSRYDMVPLHPGASQPPTIEHVQPPPSSQVMAPIVAPVQVASSASAKNAHVFPPHSPGVDPLTFSINDETQDDGGINFFKFPPFAEEHLTPSEEEESHRHVSA